jgi:hypothetical protein
MEEKFSKEMENIQNNQAEMLEMKTSINQIKRHSESYYQQTRSNRRKSIRDGGHG